LAVEVDGDSHSMGDNPERDAQRDAWLPSQGLQVLRFDARGVMNDIDALVRAIVAEAGR
jgi:very-short-patch-repair endonuclease